MDFTKLSEVKHFIATHKPHVMGIFESDIHSSKSRVQRNDHFNTYEVLTKLKIEGYHLELPDSWETFGQARVIAYVQDSVDYKRQQMNNNYDLPNITLEVGLGSEKRLC